ncbi:response regulator [Microbacterium sp. SLBN-146]|uniref:response regulator n=1 Tax=Microbacterium sp. SLBN-146 TaxID=2768457 RepID=UPI001151AC4E|nr:response regulator [Microbacterium sp. SLBN-146]TQJ32101.1 DNA-binding NarL/FixJ family response regulator [Microbacterium sp. SLBN-146]
MVAEWVRRVLVVEDLAALRVLVCDLLDRHGFITAGAADAADATRLFAEFDPDVLLTDIDLGSRPSGAELAVMLTRLAPHVGVVFLSSFPRAAAGATAMGIPRAEFVSKQRLDSPDQLISAIERSLAVRPLPSDPVIHDRAGLGGLTRHQLEVLAMVSRGWSNEQIAHASRISVRAVERSISRIFARLGLTGDLAINPRVAAAALYITEFGPVR